jgi:ABC-type phosphate/phosphonate transport system substrate-binding protein
MWLAVNRAMPAEKKEAIKKAILELDSNYPVLKNMGLTGFKLAEDHQYDVIRNVLQR